MVFSKEEKTFIKMETKVKFSKKFIIYLILGNSLIYGDSFIDNKDGTISDTSTGLLWQECTGSDYNDNPNCCSGETKLYTFHYDIQY